MRTYNDHVPFFEKELARLGSTPVVLLPQSILAVMGAGVGSREVDKACRVFAATLEWPPLTEQVRLEVYLRLLCAKWWCEDMTGAEGDCAENGEEFLTELLIDYWQDVALENLLWDALVKKRHT